MAKIESIEKKEEIYNYIKEQILRHKILPGEKIPEQEIAKALGISRTPVREAIRRLAWEGLVKLDINRGANVIVLDEAMMQDLALVRIKNDELVIPLAIYNGSPRDFEQLREIAAACMEANDQGNMYQRHALDTQFHLKIVEIAKNEVMYRIQEELNLRIQFWQNARIVSQDMLRAGLEEHFAIVDCLEGRDQVGAVRLMRHHNMASYHLDPARIQAMQVTFIHDEK